MGRVPNAGDALGTGSLPADSLGERIAVVGKSGSGKTTVAAALASHLGVPHIEMDALHWDPGWQEAPIAVFRERVQSAVAAPAWVADGNYSKVRDLVWARADTVVWLDYPLPVVLRRLLRRTASRIVRRTELYNGNIEHIRNLFDRDNLFIWTIKSHAKHRRTYPALLARPEYTHVSLAHLRTPKETSTWLERVTASTPSRGTGSTPTNKH